MTSQFNCNGESQITDRTMSSSSTLGRNMQLFGRLIGVLVRLTMSHIKQVLGGRPVFQTTERWLMVQTTDCAHKMLSLVVMVISFSDVPESCGACTPVLFGSIPIKAYTCQSIAIFHQCLRNTSQLSQIQRASISVRIMYLHALQLSSYGEPIIL